MKIIVLGSGTSTGIPEVGCACSTCNSSDIRDKRLRASVLIMTDEGKKILLDCGPDFREQALRLGIDHLDAVLLTHEHYDHIGGIDDLRTIASRESLPIYTLPRVIDSLKSRLHYVFSDKPYKGVAKLDLRSISADEGFQLFDLWVEPISIQHGAIDILGFKFGDFAYVTDMKSCEAEQWQKALDARILIVNALRLVRPHPTHQTITELLDRLEPRPQSLEAVFLTHLSHHAPKHQDLLDLLPEGISVAYDEMTITMNKNQEIELGRFEPEAELFTYTDCGRIAYAEAWERQKQIFNGLIEQKRQGKTPKSQVLFCEHNPVFTLGKHGKEENRLFSVDYLREQGYDWFEVERGGDVTYHGPGQITAYPLLDLEQFNIGLREYIELLEQAVIDLLAIYGLRAERNAGATGVWLDVDDPTKARKICAIGVRSSRYVTMHGLALNVNTDLTPFTLINPCGFVGGRVASMHLELGQQMDFYMVKQQLLDLITKKLRQAQANNQKS